MSYLVLARKSRPQHFDQIVGQGPVVKTLQNSIRRNRIAHAILFSGVRGVGKTTLARIMAKAINCAASVELRPCNNCPSCQAIADGSAIDLHEIDGASNRGIQEIRELKEKIRFLPTSAPYKVIIIDEVHMLTGEAFNALLKTLEEPPDHVYFMFATTEIHKIPITILSRCQQYELKRLSAEELYGHFAKLAAAEGFQIEAGALAIIVREAAGSVRDGLSLLDQMFAYGEGVITALDVAEVLGIVGVEALNQLTRALLDGDRSSLFTTLHAILGYGTDSSRLSEDLLNQFRNLLLCKIDGCEALLDLPKEERKELYEMASPHSRETLHLKLTLLMQMAEQLRFASQPRICLETWLLKIVESTNVVPLSRILGQLEEITAHLSRVPAIAKQEKDRPAPPPQPIKQQPQKEHCQPDDPEHKKTAPVLTAEKKKTTPSADVQQVAPKPERPAPAPQIQSRPETLEKPAPAPAKPAPETTDFWPDFIDFLKEKSIWMANNLRRVDAVQKTGNTLRLTFLEVVDCRLLKQIKNRKLLASYASEFFQAPMEILLTARELEKGADDKRLSQQKRRSQLANDPLTLTTAEVFNAQVGEIRLYNRKIKTR